MSFLYYFIIIQSLILCVRGRQPLQPQEEKRSTNNNADTTEHVMCTTRGEVRHPRTCNHEENHFDCKIFMQWKLDNESETIFFTVKTRYLYNRWVAIGFSLSRAMPQTDVYVVTIEGYGEKITLTDGWLPDYSGIKKDQSQNIRDFESVLNNDVVIITFQRDLLSNDARDANFTNHQCWFVFLAHGLLHPVWLRPSKHLELPTISKNKFCIYTCPDSNEAIEKNKIFFRFALKLEEPTYNIGLANRNSQLYREMKSKVERSLKRAYSLLTLPELHNILIEVEGFQHGSVIVVYQFSAFYNDTLPQNVLMVNLTTELQKLIVQSSGKLPGLTYTAEVVDLPLPAKEQVHAFDADNFRRISWFLLPIGIFTLFLLLFAKFFKAKNDLDVKPVLELQDDQKSLNQEESFYNNINTQTLNEEIHLVTQHLHKMLDEMKRQFTKSNQSNDPPHRSSSVSSDILNLKRRNKSIEETCPRQLYHNALSNVKFNLIANHYENFFPEKEEKENPEKRTQTGNQAPQENSFKDEQKQKQPFTPPLNQAVFRLKKNKQDSNRTTFFKYTKKLWPIREKKSLLAVFFSADTEAYKTCSSTSADYSRSREEL